MLLRLLAAMLALTLTTVAVMTRPGKSAIHQAVPRKLRPSERITPHSGVGGCGPRPRKLSPAPETIAVPTPMVASTTSGPSVLGITWRSTLATGCTPRLVAAPT